MRRLLLLLLLLWLFCGWTAGGAEPAKAAAVSFCGGIDWTMLTTLTLLFGSFE